MKKVSNDQGSQLRKLQLIQLKMLHDVVEVCEKNNLKYFLNAGTFLGAVRHKGFIPWDDDIDITMPRPDYEKFMEIAQSQLPKPLIYKNFRVGNEKSIYISEIENPNVIVKDSSALVHKTRNAWIDIFPLDGMPNNTIVRKFHQMRLLYRRLLLQYSQFSVIVNQKITNRPFHEKALIKLGKVFNFEKILNTQKCLNKLDKCLRKCDYNKSKYVVNFMSAYKFREMFEKSLYDDCAIYKFENDEFCAPKDYDKFLSQLYGDYMKLPPKENRNRHHIEILEIKGDK